MVPLLPRPIRISSLRCVVSSHPPTSDPFRVLMTENRNPKLKPGPFSSSIKSSLNATIALLLTFSLGTNGPRTVSLPQSKLISFATSPLPTSNICFTTLEDVSTVIPTADTVPLAVNCSVSIALSFFSIPYSTGSTGVHVSTSSSSLSIWLGDVYCRYQVPSSPLTSSGFDRDPNGADFSISRTIDNTLACVGGAAVRPFWVLEIVSSSCASFCASDESKTLPPPPATEGGLRKFGMEGNSKAHRGETIIIMTTGNNNDATRGIFTVTSVAYAMRWSGS
mmetsp:Transcript_26480/g.58050  ORF Transcript_26480/g.58050 Transcript_26480/m.58050 type:complete len:279 (-) Transcript_26480:103-939(-)